MTEAASFTGERLHEGDALFAVDLARHRAAYEWARTRLGAGRVLDLGCGSGHGTARLAESSALVFGLDRVPPDARSRAGGARFLRARLEAIPLRSGSFERVLSFQVIEHLADPTDYLEAIAGLLHPEGTAVLTTPNRLMSDGVNPYHVHEYVSDELAARLARHFAEVELLGVGASGPVRHILAARSGRIRRIVRLDPLRLRERLPRPLLERLFAAFAVLVRLGAASEAAPEVGWRDFPVGPADRECLDLLAVCRRPRR